MRSFLSPYRARADRPASQILTTLRSAIRLSPANDGQLAVVIIRTLVATLPGLLDDSPFWSGLGWLAIAFLQIGEPSITAAAIPLFSTVLANMHRAGYFSQRPLVDTFLDYRDADGPDSSANALDDASGVDTEINFSFALATLLVNPLRDPETLESTVGLLFQLISLARHGAAPNGTTEDLSAIEEDAIPYFLLLLPTVARMGRLEELLVAVGLAVAEPAAEGFEQYRQAARHLGIHSRDNAHLSCALAVALAQSAHDAQERVALFAVLERLAISHPDVAETL